MFSEKLNYSDDNDYDQLEIDKQEVYGNNEFLKKGCLKEGHEGQPLLHIFIKPLDPSVNTDRYGCPECVCERSGERTLSLMTVMNIKPKKSLYKFPELDDKIRQESETQIKCNSELKYDEEISQRFENLYEKLTEIFKIKEDEAHEFIKEIKELGDDAKTVYQQSTNCQFLKEVFSKSEDTICLDLDTAVTKMYNEIPVIEDRLLRATVAYNSKLAQFQIGFVSEIQRRLNDSISKIVFSNQQAGSKQTVVNPDHNVNDISVFEHSRGREYQNIEFSFENIKPKTAKLAAKISQFVMTPLEDKGVSCLVNNSGDTLTQINSTTPLDPNLTYKILFELTQGPLFSETANPFLIGIGFVKDKESLCYEKSPFQKVFQTKSGYNKGFSQVQYGIDIGKIEREDQRRFVFKFCIAKNSFKFMDENKNSVNVLSVFEKADLTKEYCLYVLNQIPQFELRIIKAQAKS